MDIQQTKNDLFDAAVKKTGLDDFGGNTFHEGLDALLYAIKHEAQLNFRGKVFLHDILLIPLLINRLHVRDWVNHHPEIIDEKIKAPVFVVGLPRSGTSFFHNLLALDPTSRFLADWEAHTPCPPPQIFNNPADPRIQRAQRLNKWVQRIAPELNKSVALHLMTGMPEECLWLLQHEFKSKGFGLYFQIPGYIEWLANCDLQSAYEYHNLLLKLLQWRCPNERWVLKAPSHLIGFRELLVQYPDAKIIFLHRDPAVSIPSGISMASAVMKIFSDSVNTREMTKGIMKLHAMVIQRVLTLREDLSDNNICDVQYSDLVKAPIATVQRCYNYFGLPLSTAYEQRMKIWLRDNPQHKHGRHKYSPEKFGLDPEDIRDRFRFYIDKMDIRTDAGTGP